MSLLGSRLWTLGRGLACASLVTLEFPTSSTPPTHWILWILLACTQPCPKRPLHGMRSAIRTIISCVACGFGSVTAVSCVLQELTAWDMLKSLYTRSVEHNLWDALPVVSDKVISCPCAVCFDSESCSALCVAAGWKRSADSDIKHRFWLGTGEATPCSRHHGMLSSGL
jgi:hypothetical protein